MAERGVLPKGLGRDEWLSRLGTKNKLKSEPSPKAPRGGISTFWGKLTALELKQAMNDPDAKPRSREAVWHARVGCLEDAGFSVTPDEWQGDYLHVTVNVAREWDTEASEKFRACFSSEVELPIEGA
jgi:hypothetical protein